MNTHKDENRTYSEKGRRGESERKDEKRKMRRKENLTTKPNNKKDTIQKQGVKCHHQAKIDKREYPRA